VILELDEAIHVELHVGREYLPDEGLVVVMAEVEG
jgi:hypothetical protein